MTEFALKQMKSACKIHFAVSALHGAFCFEWWQGELRIAPVLLQISLTISKEYCSSNQQTKKAQDQNFLLQLSVGVLSESFNSSVFSVMCNSGQNGHRNISRSTLQ